MKTPRPPTSSKTVRLPNASWPKLRQLMQHNGRQWLVKLIDREHAKLPPEATQQEATEAQP